MTGIMLDSTNPNAIIDAVRSRRIWRDMHIRAAALYGDGQYTASPAAFSLLRRFGVKTVDITVTGSPGLKVGRVAGDIEPGDLTPALAAEWAAEEKHAGEWPALYVNRTNKPAVISATIAAGIEPVRDFGLWVATLDGTFTDTDGSDLRDAPGVVAVQAFPANLLGIDADGSVLTKLGDTWLGLPTAPPWAADAATQARQLADLLAAHA